MEHSWGTIGHSYDKICFDLVCHDDDIVGHNDGTIKHSEGTIGDATDRLRGATQTMGEAGSW